MFARIKFMKIINIAILLIVYLQLPAMTQEELSEPEKVILEAIKKGDKEKLAKYIHPDCLKAYKGKEHISAFINMLTECSPINGKIDFVKGDALPKSSAIYKINEFIVYPSYNIGLTFMVKEKKKGVTLCLIRDDDKTYIVTYISDYLLEKYKSKQNDGGN